MLGGSEWLYPNALVYFCGLVNMHKVREYFCRLSLSDVGVGGRVEIGEETTDENPICSLLQEGVQISGRFKVEWKKSREMNLG